MSRKEGGRGLVDNEDSVDASIQRLKDNIEECREIMITATRNNTDNKRANRRTITRKQKWEDKHLNGHFKRQTTKISHVKTGKLLRKGNLKRETESLQKAAQNNDIRTNHIKARIDKAKKKKSKYMLHGDKDESINHIISKCSKLA